MKFFTKKEGKQQTNTVSSGPQKNWPDYVVTLDEKSFDTFIQRYPFVVVDFWASWCGPCKAMAPKLRRLSKLYKNQVAFGKLDVQQYKNIAERYHVRGIPYLVFFQHGKSSFTVTGVRSLGKLKDAIDDFLKT